MKGKESFSVCTAPPILPTTLPGGVKEIEYLFGKLFD
jgi:hypothetical protein